MAYRVHRVHSVLSRPRGCRVHTAHCFVHRAHHSHALVVTGACYLDLGQSGQDLCTPTMEPGLRTREAACENTAQVFWCCTAGRHQRFPKPQIPVWFKRRGVGRAQSYPCPNGHANPQGLGCLGQAVSHTAVVSPVGAWAEDLKVPYTGKGFCDCLDYIGVRPWSVVGRKQNIVTKLVEAEPQRAPLPVNVPLIGNVERTPVTQFLPRPLYFPQGVEVGTLG